MQKANLEIQGKNIKYKGGVYAADGLSIHVCCPVLHKILKNKIQQW